MKLAALQLMQQKANKQESSGPVLENGSSPTSPLPENGVEDSQKPPLEDGKMEENVAGLEQVKELTETMASDGGAGMFSLKCQLGFQDTGASKNASCSCVKGEQGYDF